MSSIGIVGEYFDTKADTWNQISEPAGVKHLMIAQLAGVHAGTRVLDVGCGTGIMERAYMDLGASSIVALDMSSKMIENARQSFSDVPQSVLRFECADVLDYSTDEPFDAVVIYNAYPHIQDKKALIEAVSALLKPNGRFLVAHGMSRAALDAHHSTVPHEVTSILPPAEEAAIPWKEHFQIDEMADTPFVYFFGGSKIS